MTRLRFRPSQMMLPVVTVLLSSLCCHVSGFVTPIAHSRISTGSSLTTATLFDPSSINDMATSSSLLLSETQEWVQPLAFTLDPVLNLLSFAMLCRVVLSWYPKQNKSEFPFILVVWPTEFLLRLIRNAVPPAFGVDITPIIWLGVFTFFHEILLGQQGLLTMKLKYGI